MISAFIGRQLKPVLAAAWPHLRERIGNRAMWIAGLSALAASPLRPQTVFDVGVAEGTPHLYDAFPGARFILIDPTRQSLPHMKRITRNRDARVLNIALGDHDGDLELIARPDDIGGASFFEEVGPLRASERYFVPVRRFDGLFREFARPALCKVDVQGAELMVLRGMGERIHEIDALIVDIGTLPTMQDAPEAAEVIAFMARHGFAIHDILGITRRPLDKAVAQVDVLFLKNDSPLRRDRRWDDG